MVADVDESAPSLPVPPLSGGVALLATVGTVLVVAVSTYSILAGVAGATAIGVGLARRSSRLLTLGGACLFAGVLVAGMIGLGPVLLLGGAFLTALAWNAGQLALDLVEEVGREVSTLRVEVVRLVSSSAVLAVGGSLGYFVFRRATGEPPMLALVALLAGVTAILVALQSS